MLRDRYSLQYTSVPKGINLQIPVPLKYLGARLKLSGIPVNLIGGLWCTKGIKSTDIGLPIKIVGGPIKNTGVRIILSVHCQFYRSTDKFYR